jgi:hypothetical protein
MFAKGREAHRHTYLEQQQTEKIVTEVRDVDTNPESVHMLSRAVFWVGWSA